MRCPPMILALVAVISTGCAAKRAPFGQHLTGPTSAELPIYRDLQSPDKILVIAKLPNGDPAVFLVDTGSSITTVSTEVASELGLATRRQPSRLVGIGGSTAWHSAVLDSLQIGPYKMEDVDVAVGVVGLPTRIGLVPLAGILGNNVLSHFQVSIDYPANLMVLAQSGLTIPPSAQPMFYNGQHPITRAMARAQGAPPGVQQPLLLEIDTGARGLLLIGPTIGALGQGATEGLEPIVGIGSPEGLPPSTLLRSTRRIPLTSIQLGGVTLKGPLSAVWLDHDRGTPQALARGGVPGLLGHALMARHRVIIDYRQNYFALVESTSTPQQRSIHQWYLDRIRKRHDPQSRLQVARLQLWLGQASDARTTLAKLVSRKDASPGAIVLHARLKRADGDPAGAEQELASLGVQSLIDQGELVARVNSLWLSGRSQEAEAMAKEATEIAPKSPSAWIAYADALRATGHRTAARHAIQQANHLEENPDGHLLRRGWIAVEDGDQFAALTHLRRLLDLYPASGIVQWLYAKQASDSKLQEMIRQDLQRAQDRLHAGDGPLDFMAAAWREVGEADRAQRLMDAGRARDCPRATSDQSRDNCQAWYQALVHTDLDDARIRIDRALAKDPGRAEFLDTLAMVLEAQGHLQAARDAAVRAASMAPDDVYLLVQAARLSTAVQHR